MSFIDGTIVFFNGKNINKEIADFILENAEEENIGSVMGTPETVIGSLVQEEETPVDSTGKPVPMAAEETLKGLVSVTVEGSRSNQIFAPAKSLVTQKPAYQDRSFLVDRTAEDLTFNLTFTIGQVEFTEKICKKIYDLFDVDTFKPLYLLEPNDGDLEDYIQQEEIIRNFITNTLFNNYFHSPVDEKDPKFGYVDFMQSKEGKPECYLDLRMSKDDIKSKIIEEKDIEGGTLLFEYRQGDTVIDFFDYHRLYEFIIQERDHLITPIVLNRTERLYSKLDIFNNERFYYNVLPFVGNISELIFTQNHKGYITIPFQCDAPHGWVDRKHILTRGKTSAYIYGRSNFLNKENNYRIYPFMEIKLDNNGNGRALAFGIRGAVQPSESEWKGPDDDNPNVMKDWLVIDLRDPNNSKSFRPGWENIHYIYIDGENLQIYAADFNKNILTTEDFQQAIDENPEYKNLNLSATPITEALPNSLFFFFNGKDETDNYVQRLDYEGTWNTQTKEDDDKQGQYRITFYCHYPVNIDY